VPSPPQPAIAHRLGYRGVDKLAVIGTKRIVIVGLAYLGREQRVLLARRLRPAETRAYGVPAGSLAQKVLWWFDPHTIGSWVEFVVQPGPAVGLLAGQPRRPVRRRRTRIPASIPRNHWIDVPSTVVFSEAGCATIEVRTSTGLRQRLSFEVRKQ
jgi:hypothetical protein